MKLKNLGLSTSSWKNKAKIDWQNLFGDAASLEVEFDNFFSASQDYIWKLTVLPVGSGKLQLGVNGFGGKRRILAIERPDSRVKAVFQGNGGFHREPFLCLHPINVLGSSNSLLDEVRKKISFEVFEQAVAVKS